MALPLGAHGFTAMADALATAEIAWSGGVGGQHW